MGFHGRKLYFGFQCFWTIFGLMTVAWCATASAPHCSDSDFDSQVRLLLKNEMLTQTEIANRSTVFNNLEETLQLRWPGSQVFPLGSFVTGLASKSSDADCMVTVPHHDVTSARHLVLQTAHLLYQHPALYSNIRPKAQPHRRIPLLKFTYNPTQRNCDVNFISNFALQNTQMMAYYFSLNTTFLYLAAILKFWAKVTQLRSTDALESNTLNLLIIFYLQQESIAPPFILLQKHLVRCPVNHWETSFKRISYNTTRVVSLYDLLGGFFKYYSDFNFNEYVVSPLIGRPIPKKDFKDIYSLPDELFLYKNYMKTPGSKPLVLSTKLCVQDAIELRRNTADVSDLKADLFISHVKYAAYMFSVVSKDDFLKVLLSKKVRVDSASELTGTEIRLNDCVNITVNKL